MATRFIAEPGKGDDAADDGPDTDILSRLCHQVRMQVS